MTLILLLSSVLVCPGGPASPASPREQGEPPQSKPTAASPDMRLTYKEKSRGASKGFESVTCVFRAEGFPETKRYSLSGQWMNGKTAEVSREIRIDQAGRLLGPGGDELDMLLAGMFPGEFVVFSIVSEDGSAKGSVEITPFPIQAVGAGGCSLSVRPMSANGQVFSITGQGFHPDEKIKGIAVSSGERSEAPISNKDGTLKMVVFPAVVGRSGGEASFTASDSACAATVNYKWGDQMRGPVLTTEQRAALSQQMTVIDSPSSKPVPTISKPVSSGESGGWSALAQRGRSLWKEGKRAEAEPLLAQSLAMVEKELGPNNANVARLSFDLASLDTSLGKYSEAEPLFQRALAMAEKAFGPDNGNVAVVLTSYAGLMRKTNRPEEADQLEARVRKIRGGAAH